LHILLAVSFGTCLSSFIEIDSYLTNREQKISWHSFFLRHGVQSRTKYYVRISIYLRKYTPVITNVNSYQLQCDVGRH